MNLYQQLADKVKELTVFCIEQRGKCFAEFDAAKLFRYVAFHLLNGTLFVGYENGKVALVVFAWPENSDDLRCRNDTGTPLFVWQQPATDGDAFLIGGVVGNRKFMPEVLKQVNGAWPDSPRKKLFTFRRGRFVEISWKAVERFTCYGFSQNS